MIWDRMGCGNNKPLTPLEVRPAEGTASAASGRLTSNGVDITYWDEYTGGRYESWLPMHNREMTEEINELFYSRLIKRRVLEDTSFLTS